MSETDTKTITGRCSEVAEKNGWTAFSIDVGTQYPMRLSTKLDPLIELGRAASKDGGAFDWTYKESQGGENPHKPGTFYTNRYLEGVEPAGSVPASGQGPSPTTEGMSKEDWARKDSAIHEMACIKTASDALKHTIPSDPTPEDLTKFLGRCAVLVASWHQAVISVRDGDEPPFLDPDAEWEDWRDTYDPQLSEHDQAIPFG